MTLRERLEALAEPGYRAFAASLLPGVDDLLGVRLPLLRRMAREIARGDWRAYLATAGGGTFEERMLQGLVIRSVRCDAEERLRHVQRFLPLIDNWSVCDSFCSRLPSAEREPMRRFIEPLFRSEREFEVRFAAVTTLVDFVDAEHLDETLHRLGTVRHEGYYARMGAAWAVSVCFARFPERTRAWLAEGCPLDAWTYSRALRKIVESDRVSAELKHGIRALARR